MTKAVVQEKSNALYAFADFLGTQLVLTRDDEVNGRKRFKFKFPEPWFELELDARVTSFYYAKDESGLMVLLNYNLIMVLVRRKEAKDFRMYVYLYDRSKLANSSEKLGQSLGDNPDGFFEDQNTKSFAVEQVLLGVEASMSTRHNLEYDAWEPVPC